MIGTHHQQFASDQVFRKPVLCTLNCGHLEGCWVLSLSSGSSAVEVTSSDPPPAHVSREGGAVCLDHHWSVNFHFCTCPLNLTTKPFYYRKLVVE